jgi:hypothetical protein
MEGNSFERIGASVEVISEKWSLEVGKACANLVALSGTQEFNLIHTIVIVCFEDFDIELTSILRVAGFTDADLFGRAIARVKIQSCARIPDSSSSDAEIGLLNALRRSEVLHELLIGGTRFGDHQTSCGFEVQTVQNSRVGQ